MSTNRKAREAAVGHGIDVEASVMVVTPIRRSAEQRVPRIG
jgi:hypothetical protein